MDATDSVPTPGTPAPDPPSNPFDDLTRDLVDDLRKVLGRPVEAADLIPRRDGAAAPIIGLLALTDRRRRETASQLAAEWASAGTAQREQADALAAPIAFDFATLRVDGRRLMHGVHLTMLPNGIASHEALERLVATTAILVGAVRNVVAIEPGASPGFERIPGWVARLRLLARQDELGPVKDVDGDLGQWVCDTQENASSVFLPDAEAGSLWQELMTALREQTLATLNELDQDVTVDLYLRDSDGFQDAVDWQRSVTLADHRTRSGNVLQIVRLPRRHDERIARGAVLVAPGD